MKSWSDLQATRVFDGDLPWQSNSLEEISSECGASFHSVSGNVVAKLSAHDTVTTFHAAARAANHRNY